MSKKITISISAKLMNDFENDLNEYGKRICKYVASTGRDMIAKKMDSIIDRFYREYTPGDDSRHMEDNFYDHFLYKLYVRHHDREANLNPGLQLIYYKFYSNPHNTIYSGGIVINTEKMYTDYHIDNSFVLESFLDGYHGPEFMGIHKGTFPLREIMDYRDYLVDNIEEIFGDGARSYASSFPYQILRV